MHAHAALPGLQVTTLLAGGARCRARRPGALLDRGGLIDAPPADELLTAGRVDG